MSIHDFANRNQDELIQAYLQNKLTPEEAIEFEVYIMDKSELLEKLQMDNLLQQSMHNMQQTTALAPANEGFWKPLYSNVLAAASCAALFIVVGTTQFNVPPTLTNTQSPSIIYLESFRGDKNIFDVKYTQHETFKILAIDLPPASQGVFNLSITNNKAQSVVTSTLSPNANNELIFILYADALTDGAFQLNVTQQNNNISTYDLMVKRHEH